jgi:ubiquinone/menaquinone biosynthesis C-methylase UbiE
MSQIIYDTAVSLRYKRFVNIFHYPAGIHRFITRSVHIRNGDRILDAGCGYGTLSKAVNDKLTGAGLSGIEQHAFDISPYMLSEFRKKNHFPVELKQLDVRDLPYPDNYFDLILTAAMLEYVPNIEDGLTSLRRVLKSEGRLYVFMSRNTALNNLLFKPFGNPRCYSPQDLRDILLKSGFAAAKQLSFPPSFFWLNLWGYVFEANK